MFHFTRHRRDRSLAEASITNRLEGQTKTRMLVSVAKASMASGAGIPSTRLLLRLLESYDYVQSLYWLRHPRAGHVLVVIMSDATPDFLSKVLALQTTSPPRLSLICLRVREVVLCSVPDRFAIHLDQLHLYLQRDRPIYGTRPREIKCDSMISMRESLLFTLEHFLLYTRSHIVLSALAAGRYKNLVVELENQLVQLVDGLLSISGREFTQAKRLEQNQLDEISCPRLREQLIAWINARCGWVSKGITEETAFQAVWIFESALRCIRGLL